MFRFKSGVSLSISHIVLLFLMGTSHSEFIHFNPNAKQKQKYPSGLAIKASPSLKISKIKKK